MYVYSDNNNNDNNNNNNNNNKRSLFSKKRKKVFIALNYVEQLLSLVSAITGYVSISDFVSFVGFSKGIASFGVGSKICVLAAGIKNYKWIIKWKKKSIIK